MIIKQLSIFLENKSGRLTEVLEILGEEKISIKALTIADTSEYGILRLIVSDPEKAYSLLKEKNFSANLNDVISIAAPNEAGAFAKALKLLSEDGISVEYMYSFSHGKKAILVLRTDNRDRALKVFQEHEMELIRASDLYKI
jgi:hypothetical protein